MGDAPEKIWAQRTATGWDEPIAATCKVDHFHEYIRADIHESALAEIARLRAQLEDRVYE